MSPLEAAFDEALKKNLEEAERDCGVAQKRLRADVERFGGASCAKEMLRQGWQSDGFEALADAGRLDLSLEALVTAGRFGALFTDDEVNACFSALCAAGYYTLRG